MPRTRGGRKSRTAAAKKETPAAEEQVVDNEPPANEELDESVASESQNMSKEESSQIAEASEDQEESVAVEDVSMTEPASSEAREEVSDEKAAGGQGEAVEKVETMETDETKQDESEDKRVAKKQKGKKTPVILYRPHSIPNISNKSLQEKWEWHLKFFPIDQSDIRSCILESVSKIAQETWLYIDKQNYGMGSYDMCVKSHNDAAMIMLKTLAMPIMYRYLTVEVTRRGQNQMELNKIAKAREDAGDSDEDESENLPFSEVLEKATILLDFMHTPAIVKAKGQEKKRCLYVKYLPQGTTKEFLKVLFPVANNLDILTTGEGRRFGSLNVSTVPNIFGICNAYVTVHIEKNKTITLDWHEENLDDGFLLNEAYDELPWEILPRNFEYPYETIPEMTEDDFIEYARRRRNLEETLMRHDPKDRDRDRRARERDREADVTSLVHMQQQMNEKISSQIALLTAVDSAQRAPPSLLGVPPLMSLVPGEPPFLRGREERRGGRGERDRRNSSGGRRSPEKRDRQDRRDRSGRKERGRDGRPSRWDTDGTSLLERDGGRFERDRSSGRDPRREDRNREGPKRRPDDRGRGPELFDHRNRRAMFGDGRGDMFDMRGPERFDYPGLYEHELAAQFAEDRRRFEMEERGGHFELGGGGRVGPFSPDVRGGHFGAGIRGGPFDDGGPGPFSNFNRGGPFDSPEMEMSRGMFANRGRGRKEDRGRGRFEERRGGKLSDIPKRGGGGGRQFEERGRGKSGGHAGPGAFGKTGSEGILDTPVAKISKPTDVPGRGGHVDRGGRGGRNTGRAGFSNISSRGNMEGAGNQRGTSSRGGHSGLGSQPTTQVPDGGQWRNISDQGVPTASGGNQPGKQSSNLSDNKNNFGKTQNQSTSGQQGSYGKDINTGSRKGASSQQGNIGAQGSFGNQQQNMGQSGYGNQAMKNTSIQDRFGKQQNANSQSSFGNKQNTNPQSGFSKQQNVNPQSGFGNQQNKPQGSFGNQQNKSLGSQQNKPQGGFGNQQNKPQGGFGNQQKSQSGFGNQQNKPQGGFGNQQKSQGGFGNQQKSQGGFSNQQNVNPQGGFGGSQNMNAQSGFGNQQNMMGNQGGFGGNQQMSQPGYTTQQGAQSNYGNQQTTNIGQGSFSNQPTDMNNPPSNYGMNQQGSYSNQVYSGYSDSSYNQNYMGGQQTYGSYDSTNVWSQNIDYSQYGQSAYSTDGGQTGNASASSTSQTTGYTTQGANVMGYTGDTNYAAQGYYNTGQTDASANYGTYNTQGATSSSYTSNMTDPSNLATYNFASYNTGSS